jgi:uncharacterized membrane protein YkoI
MKDNRIIAAIVAAALSIIPFSLEAEEKEAVVKLSEIPAAAAAALEKHAAGGQIVKVEKDEENGKISYEAQIKTASGVSEVSVDASGALLSVEDVIALAAAPEAVRTAIEKEAAEGKVEKLERVKEGGKTSYEALIAKKGKREEVVFSESGQVVEREKKTGKKEND